MWFGELPVSECVGCLLAHSQVIGSGRVSKGTVLDESLIQQFCDNGYEVLTVARIDTDDIEENSAARMLAEVVSGAGTRLEKAHTGRVNIFATTDGLLDYDRASIVELNSVRPDITLAVVAPDQWVLAGRMIASVKIIPYAVPAADIKRAVAAATAILVHSPQPTTAVLIQTVLPSITNKALDKTERVTRQRLDVRSAELTLQERCDHQVPVLCDELAKVSASNPDLILIAGASAISDRCDVIPAAIEQQGGRVSRVGLPVDPGNLLMFAELNGVPVIGLPGCARSPKHNGFDLLLDKIVCRREITDGWLNGLSIGGLLGEVHDRPQPRVASEINNSGIDAASVQVGAIVLAAGSSQRAGNLNKLLHMYNEKPMICSVVESVLASDVTSSLVVTGYQSEQVTTAIGGYPIPVIHCPRHSDGMAHTIATGLSQLQKYDAVIVCLGDMPHVSADVINQIISAFDQLVDKIVVPVYNSKRGNPVLVGRTFFDSLLQHHGDTGARFLMKEYPEKVFEVELDTMSVIKDYDTADALKGLDAS